jgi:glycosyltransferase involved in cell wall biosynthesis
VRITGWVTREEIRGLYRRAHACVYPSTFEGFGLPVLESMAAGVPTACSSIPPLREVAGDAALLFHPVDEDGMLAALRSITSDQALRERLAVEGPRRAARFTWKRCARQTLEVLLEAASSG